MLAAAVFCVAGCGGDRESDEKNQAVPTSGEQSRGVPTPIAQGMTTLELSRSLKLLLSAAGVDVVPLGPASASEAGIELPVASGTLGIEPVAGRLRHEGGIRLSAGSQSIDATAVVLDLSRRAVTADVAGTRLDLLSVEFEPPQLSRDADLLALAGREARLSDAAVAPLNHALGVGLLSGGMSVGKVSVDARWP